MCEEKECTASDERTGRHASFLAKLKDMFSSQMQILSGPKREFDNVRDLRDTKDRYEHEKRDITSSSLCNCCVRLLFLRSVRHDDGCVHLI